MKNKLLIGLVGILVLVLTVTGCVQCPTCPEPPPCPTQVDTSGLEARLEACQAALGAIGGEAAEVEERKEPPPPLPPTVCLDAISCEEAKANIGERGTVRGMIVDAHYSSGSSGQPTFLNLCCPYPEPCRFTVLIWGEDRQEFIDCLGGPPEQMLLNREVCVEGLIEIYEGIPEIILTQCDQLMVAE